MKDIVCRCGHKKKEHKKSTSTGSIICEVMDDKNSDYYADECVDYIPDNLMHIEQLAKERKLL
jgi:hypothetical protein